MLPEDFHWRRSREDIGLIFGKDEIAHATIASGEGAWRLWFSMRQNIPNYRSFGTVFAAATYAEAWVLKWEVQIRDSARSRCSEIVSGSSQAPNARPMAWDRLGRLGAATWPQAPAC